MSESLEKKRQAASDYLRSRGIHRADPDCRHRYECNQYTPPPPRIDTSPSGIKQNDEKGMK